MKKDGDNLFIRYEKECDCFRKAEDNVARYRARLRLCEDSTRSSLSSTQPRAQSPDGSAVDHPHYPRGWYTTAKKVHH